MLELVIGFFIGAILAGIVAFFMMRILQNGNRQSFEEITRSIMQEKSDEILDRNKSYQEYLNEIHKYDIKDRESLREKLNFMLDSAGRIEKEANQLSSALKSDVKFQGAWGELVLEKVLELSGLVKDQEYSLQNTLKIEEKTYRPDAIIYLPNDAHIIIDSKVSLKSYFDYMNEDQTDIAIKELKKSLQNHIDSLSKKSYQNLENLNSPNFVYLFIPVEGVYALLLKEYPQLIDESLKKNIVLVSPVNLIANLKTVTSLWRLEKQSQNAEELAQKAGAMYDKFVSLVDDVEKVGASISKAHSTYLDLTKKLSLGKGNLVGRAEELKQLGAKTSKKMDEKHLRLE